MGNWRNRPPRRFYREKPPPSSPPRPHELENDNVPAWEKRFCAVIGSVPWWKVVNGKKLMFCSSNVVNWDDSAGEEAFHNAKRRFWANINRLPCDISLPDPNMYVDKINWNPSIDPKLIEELDQAYFAPNDEMKYGRQNKRAKQSSPSDEYNRSQYASDNPWERDNIQGSGTFKNGAHGRDQCDSRVNESGVSNNNENPWEAGYAQAGAITEITGWGQSRDGSWGRNLEGNNTKNWDSGGNAWNHGCEAVSAFKDRGWGDDMGNNNSWGRNHWESRNSGNGRFIKDGGGRGDSSWSWKQRDNYANESKTLEHKRNNVGWEPWNEDLEKKKREDSQCRYRFQGNGYRSGTSYWSQGKAKKRVNFAS